MYETEPLQTQATLPMVRIRCMDGAVGKWLPLQQNWSSRSCTLPERYMKNAQRIHAFETRDSDVFVVTFMKCGTTWMQELAWLLLNQLNFTAAKSSYLTERSSFLEFSATIPLSVDTITACEEMVSPRLIKSHLPAQLLPQQVWQQGRKIIYVARNPKDVVVSSYHFLNGIKMWKGDLDTFVNEFMKDEILYTSFWSHIVDFWRMRNEPNIFFVTYEEMKRDLRAVVKRLCKFLSVDDVKDNQMEQLLQHLSFDNMKGSKYSNVTDLIKKRLNTTEDFEFMRRGVVGSYNDELSALQRQKLDKWTSDFLKAYDIRESDIFGDL